MRTGGAEALAFDVACLAGPEAALPHGSPGDRPVVAGEVLLFDFGAQVEGYRSDMTRTLFVGEPPARDLAVYDARAAGPAGRDRRAARRGVADGALPDGRALDAIARGVIDADGTLAGVRPRPGARDRARDARGAAPLAHGAGDAAAQPDRVQRGARHLPRGRDRRPHRGPRPPRRVARHRRAADPLPAGRHRAGGLTPDRGCRRCCSPRRPPWPAAGCSGAGRGLGGGFNGGGSCPTCADGACHEQADAAAARHPDATKVDLTCTAPVCDRAGARGRSSSPCGTAHRSRRPSPTPATPDRSRSRPARGSPSTSAAACRRRRSTGSRRRSGSVDRRRLHHGPCTRDLGDPGSTSSSPMAPSSRPAAAGRAGCRDAGRHGPDRRSPGRLW